VVGALQLDVLKSRLNDEYGIPIDFETSRFDTLRWIAADESRTLDVFVEANRSSIAHDLDGAPVMLATSLFNLNYTLERAPGIKVATIKEIHA
jgi:peptide chain release factor 3